MFGPCFVVQYVVSFPDLHTLAGEERASWSAVCTNWKCLCQFRGIRPRMYMENLL